MQTQAVRGKLERKLEKRSGVAWTIGSLSWTPWTGLQVRNVTVDAPRMGDNQASRFLCRAELDVKLHWSSLLRGALDLREVRVRKGQIAIPMELLFLLPVDTDQPKSAASGPSPDASSRKERKEIPPTLVKPAEKSSPPAGEPKATLVMAPSLRIVIDQCDLQVYSDKAQGKPALTLRDIGGVFPLRGEDASGWARCGGIMIGRRSFEGEWVSKVEWRRPALRLPPMEFVWNGLTVRGEGFLQMSRMPRFRAAVHIPGSTLQIAEPAQTSAPGITLAVEQVRLQAVLGGTLARLSSWQGNLALEAGGISLAHDKKAEIMTFDEGRMIAGLRGGTFHLPDARLQGERLSFLGNGVLLPTGELGGVIRVVADQDHAKTLTRFALGAMWTGGWTRSWLAPMETPDRYYRDVVLEGTVNEAVVNVGREGEKLDVTEAWDKMLTFLRNETLESEKSGTTEAATEILSR